MKMESLSLGYSPCPNDTFIFYGLVHGKISLPGYRFQDPVLEDVEQLNLRALEGQLDITKLSFHALAHVLDDYCVLGSGSALGRGCGPLLVGRKPFALSALKNKRIAIPGKLTTAALLLRMFLPDCIDLVEMRFDLIMQSIENGTVEAGVIIHESRFVYEQHGLVALQDLGQWWEDLTGLPLPLGCIAMKRSLGDKAGAAVEQAIRKSVQYALAHPEHCLPYIHKHSQELTPDVVKNHINLYVNDYSENLGEEGIEAISRFLQKGHEAGVLPPTGRPFMVQ
ncbi:menaquinone biosynthesis family protein [Desulfomarina sp.]